MEVKTFKPKVLVDKICSDETLGQIKGMPAGCSSKRTWHRPCIETNVYQFAGKTGTAVTAMDNRGYNKGNKIYQSAFIGYFPAENPKYSIAVVIQNSSESKLVYGGVVSGPVFREVADKIYAEKIGSESLNIYCAIAIAMHYKFYGLKNDVNKIL